MAKAKILLDISPMDVEECPFVKINNDSYYRQYNCIIGGCECHCISGYSDSISFDFDKCPYCKQYARYYTNE